MMDCRERRIEIIGVGDPSNVTLSTPRLFQPFVVSAGRGSHVRLSNMTIHDIQMMPYAESPQSGLLVASGMGS